MALQGIIIPTESFFIPGLSVTRLFEVLIRRSSNAFHPQTFGFWLFVFLLYYLSMTCSPNSLWTRFGKVIAIQSLEKIWHYNLQVHWNTNISKHITIAENEVNGTFCSGIMCSGLKNTYITYNFCRLSKPRIVNYHGCFVDTTGGAMNINTGLFNVTVAGIYQLSFTAKYVSSNKGRFGAWSDLFVNNAVVADSQREYKGPNGEANESESSTHTMMLMYPLHMGDIVKVKFNRDSTSYMHSDGDHDVHFTARLVQYLPWEREKMNECLEIPSTPCIKSMTTPEKGVFDFSHFFLSELIGSRRSILMCKWWCHNKKWCLSTSN